MSEIKKKVEVMALVLGMTKLQIMEDVKKGLPEELHPEAEKQILDVFQGRNKMPRESIRKNRRAAGMTFSNLVKKKLR